MKYINITSKITENTIGYFLENDNYIIQKIKNVLLKDKIDILFNYLLNKKNLSSKILKQISLLFEDNFWGNEDDFLRFAETIIKKPYIIDLNLLEKRNLIEIFDLYSQFKIDIQFFEKLSNISYENGMGKNEILLSLITQLKKSKIGDLSYKEKLIEIKGETSRFRGGSGKNSIYFRNSENVKHDFINLLEKLNHKKDEQFNEFLNRKTVGANSLHYMFSVLQNNIEILNYELISNFISLLYNYSNVKLEKEEIIELFKILNYENLEIGNNDIWAFCGSLHLKCYHLNEKFDNIIIFNNKNDFLSFSFENFNFKYGLDIIKKFIKVGSGWGRNNQESSHTFTLI